MACYPDILTQYVDWCGNRLLVRPVRPDDAPRFVTASRLCNAADLRFRFLSSMHRLSEDIEDYAISRGITELWGVVNPDNLRAQAFFRHLNFRVGFHIDYPFTHIAKSLT